MHVLNYDPNKVKIDIYSNTVIKNSSALEINQIKFAKEYLKLCPIILDCGIEIEVIQILNYKENKLITKYSQGINIEHALKYDVVNKPFWLKVCRQMLEKFRERGFFWGDIAPRNMIFDKVRGVIYIFDFERSLIVKDVSVGKERFSNFVRQYAYEEFSCLLTLKDQKKLFTDIILDSKEYSLSVDKIISNRRKFLLNLFFGDKNIYSSKEINYVEDLMSSIATPFYLNRSVVVYPMFFIEKAIKNKGVYIYEEIAKQINRQSTAEERLCALKKVI